MSKSIRAKTSFCLLLFALSLLIGVPSFPQYHTSYASSPNLVNLVVDPRPPLLIADNRTYPALVLEFVNESTNLPAIPTKNVTILLSSSNLHVGNVSTSVIFPAGAIFDIANFTTTYYAGTTNVTALANSSMPSVPGTAQVTTTLGGEAATGLELFANPSSMPAESGFVSNIVVEAVDSQMNPVQVSQPVQVALSSSDLSVGSLPVSLTIPAGQSFASTNFTATNTAGSTKLSASANGFNATEMTLSTYPQTNAAVSLSVQVAPQGLISDGQVYSNVISVSLLTATGLPAIAGNSVTVYINASSSILSPGSLSTDELTISSGSYSAYVSFDSSLIPGNTTIFASAPNFLSASANLTMLPPPAMKLMLYSIPTSVLAGGTGYQNLLEVQLQEANGTPSEATSPVFVELGMEDSAYGTVSPSVTIPKGYDYAFVNLTTAALAGPISITAIASGYATGYATVTTIFLPATILVSESAQDIPNTGTSLVTITASSESVPLVGASVAWSVPGGSSLGSFSGESLITNSAGEANATYHPGSVFGSIPLMISVSKPDYVPSNASASVVVYSQQLDAVLTASPGSTPVLNSSSLKLVVTSSGSSVANASVQWSASAGSILNASSLTDNNGVATATFQAGANASSVQIQAKVTKSGYFTYLANVTDDVYVPTLNVNNYAPSSVRGGENSSISIQVMSGTSIVPNATVSWMVESGPISNFVGTSVTNSSGYSVARFVAQNTAGQAEVQANITKSGMPSYIDDIEFSVNLLNMSVKVLEPHPSIIENYKSAFSLLVLGSGSPLDNASVSWNATGGTLLSSSLATNSSGYANAIFQSGAEPGNMSVTALISKLGYYNYSETIYFVVVVPTVGGPTNNGSPGSSNFLLINIGNVLPIWALIVIAAGAAGGFFFYKKRQSPSGVYYEEE